MASASALKMQKNVEQLNDERVEHRPKSEKENVRDRATALHRNSRNQSRRYFAPRPENTTFTVSRITAKSSISERCLM